MQLSPRLLFDTLNAYQRTAALHGAIDLNLFTAIAEGASTVPAMALAIGASEKGVRVLSDYLVVLGFLTKAGDSYALTEESAAFLDRQSPTYLGAVSGFWREMDRLGPWDDIAATVRKGGTLLPEGGSISRNNPVWQQFARSMAGRVRPTAEAVVDIVGSGGGKPLMVLDLAGGHGHFGIAFAKRNPLAHIVCQDWPAVLEIASENAEEAGVADRHWALPGSAFEVDFGSQYDLVLITNFLHHFSEPVCGGILEKVHAALKPGGRAVTLEYIPNDDRVSPPEPAQFALTMLASTAEGDAYTFAEYERMFAAARFKRSELHDLPMSPQRVIVSYK